MLATQNAHSYKVDDILYSSWGYDQTNVDFYRVVAVTATTISVRELAKNYDRSNASGGTAMPGNEFRSEEVLRRKVRGEMIRIDDSSRAYRWDGKPLMFSNQG